MDRNNNSIHREPKERGDSDSDRPTHYVGLGASAGGLEAIETFFAHMPAKNGLAFILVQHLSPDYKSLMVELLSKRTEMKVHRAEDGLVVERDNVYLIPPKKNLTIFHGKLFLRDQDSSRGLNLPIDIFLRSLAEDQGEKAIGIILSGTGSDGMRGTRSIKENGGMIMVQDEETAKFNGMPRSAISTGLADFVLPPEEMPEQLLAFARHPCIVRPERSVVLQSDQDVLTRIFSLLREKSKVDFTYYKPSTIIRRIERRMSVNQLDNIRDYVDFLQGYPGEVMALYREFLIGVTRFFRDREAFKELREQWLPDLLQQKKNQEIRFWVTGCSTGEEAYTFAIMVRECLEQLGRSLDVKIFATDVDKEAVLRAGTGIYSASIAADLSPGLLSKYFYRRDEHFQIARNIREMVVFAQHNLIRDPPFTNIDLISCRNLLIYLQAVIQKKVMELINFSLNTDGLLMLGTSETVGDMGDYFKILSQKYKIFRSTGRMKPVVGGHDPLSVPVRKPPPMTPRYTLKGGAYRRPDSEKTLERLLDSITGDYVPLTLIVNEALEVHHVFGNTEGYLKVPSGRISNDLSKMASKDLTIPLTTGIQKVFRTGEELRFSHIHLHYLEATKSVNLRIKPLPRKKGQDPLAAVFLSEVKTEKPESAKPVIPYDLSKEAEQRIKDLEQELQFNKENLQATIEELETANEELQATNEELLASNEELQSTNEELQATNEELHTVNSEYHDKIIELTELNNDVENLLSNTQIGTLLLDENLDIRKFSPLVTQILEISDKDAGRPITQLNHYIANQDFFEIIHQVQASSVSVEEQVLIDSGRWYLMYVRPYAIGPRKFSGIVLSFIEITQIKQAQAALADREALLKQTAGLAKVGSWEVDVETGDQKWSEETYRIHELEPGRAPTPEDGIQFYAPESKPVIREAFENACRHGKAYDLVLELITAGNQRRWVRTIGHPLVVDGKVVKVSGAFQDITELMEIGEALRASETRYRELFTSMSEGFALHEVITDQEGHPVDYRFLAVNPAFEKLTGLSGQDIIGRTVLEVLPQTEEYWIDRYGNVALTGKTDYFENYSGELGKWYSVTVYSPRKNQFSVIFADITARKLMEAELRDREELFRTLFETMAQGVVYQNAEGEIIRANKAAERILGLSLDQMQGRISADPRWRAIHEDGSDFPGETHPSMMALQTTRAVENVIMGIFNPLENDTKWININAVPQFKPGENKPFQVYTTFEDLTARFLAEKETRIAKERLDLAFAAAGLVWWDWNVPENHLIFGPKTSRLFGYDFEPAGRTFEDWVDLIHPEDREKIREAMRSYLEGETACYDVTYRLEMKEERHNRVRDRGIIVERDERNRPRRLIGAVQENNMEQNGNESGL